MLLPRRFWGIAALAACALLGIGCSDKPPIAIPRNTRITDVAVLGDLTRESVVTFSATLTDVSWPYDAVWQFGGGAVPNEARLADQNGTAAQAEVKLTGPGTYTGTVLLLRVQEGLVMAGPYPFTFTVGPKSNSTPRITAVALAGQVIQVTVADADRGDDLTVSVSSIAPGLTVTPSSLRTTDGGTVIFRPELVDQHTPVYGAIGFVVQDDAQLPNSTSEESRVYVQLGRAHLPTDVLVATPLKTIVKVGEPVTVLVLTSILPMPFLSANVALTTDATGEYVPGSFNIGAPGGEAFDVDGTWADMNDGTGPSGGFLMPPLQVFEGRSGGPGLVAWDFNVTPVGGSELTGSDGALFNCQFTFSTPGTKTFGFEAVNSIKRTYYADESTEYFWGNIANDGSIVPNSVEVE
jgi:hypothetical protein